MRELRFFTGSDGFCHTEQPKGQFPDFMKDADAFNKKEGVCYKDENGRTYTYNDILFLCRNEDTAEKLFERLRGNSPEEELETTNWKFIKCSRCGAWHYTEDRGLFKKNGAFYCKRCTPLRTDGKIALQNDPYEDDRKFFAKRTANFRPGITTLVGCNGIGKSTMLHGIEHELKERGTPYILFDNLGEEGGEKSSSLGSVMWKGRRNFEAAIEKAAFLSESSEGEKIVSALLSYISSSISDIKGYAGYGELWLLFDAIDSGLSADYIEDIKDGVFGKIIDSAPEGTRIYIIASSNSYEMSSGTMCFSVEKMRYVNIRSYDAFVKAVKSSRKYKAKRDEVLALKAEIASRPYTYSKDDRLMECLDTFYHGGPAKGNAAFMEMCGYRMVLAVKASRSDTGARFELYRRGGEGYVRIPAGNADIDTCWLRKEDVETKMHGYLCRRVFLDERKKKTAK